jgi:hypothetical protein
MTIDRHNLPGRMKLDQSNRSNNQNCKHITKKGKKIHFLSGKVKVTVSFCSLILLLYRRKQFLFLFFMYIYLVFSVS